jgi:hypothetical protein
MTAGNRAPYRDCVRSDELDRHEADSSAVPLVLESCRRVMAAARYVSIDPQAVAAFAGKLAREGMADAYDPLQFRGSRAACANFVLITDALNFCFWSHAPWKITYGGQAWTRTFAMVAGMLRAIETDPAWVTAERWASATDDDVADLFTDVGVIPLAQRRREVLNETGTILREEYAGEFTNIVEAVERDAMQLARGLAVEFPSFRDVATHPAGPVAFLKRAQICAADLHRTWNSQGHGGLRNMEALTVFADYRLPQLFRYEGMLILAGAFARRIDREDLIEADSQEEVEIRAATVVIGEQICAALRDLHHPITAWELDYELWRRARLPEVTVPHHRTVTHFY